MSRSGTGGRSTPRLGAVSNLRGQLDPVAPTDDHDFHHPGLAAARPSAPCMRDKAVVESISVGRDVERDRIGGHTGMPKSLLTLPTQTISVS
jgi:hypothetical protein